MLRTLIEDRFKWRFIAIQRMPGYVLTIAKKGFN